MLDGVLFFPVTPFGADGTVDYEALAEHVRRGLAAGPGGVFVACGTGEFHALEAGEYASIVSTAVQVVGGAVPVFAGAGGSVVHARGFAREAERAVSLVKAGVTLAGLPAGSVRPPLVDPTPEHVEQLAAIIAAGRAAAAGLTGEVSQPQMVG
jgi:dihydrodipicolinate synthase/N-acetylneuraminate lyase